MITLDIETRAIVEGSPLLPEPVGCAIKWAGDPTDVFKVVVGSQYFSWGHPTENNCTSSYFATILEEFIWNSSHLIITHNGLAFDIPILQHYFNLPKIDPLRVHDTLFLSYLHNPHANSLQLKRLAADWLGVPPDEQTELYDWIMANTACKSRKQAGAYISEAPGDLVGKYAVGDVERTLALYQHLAPIVLPSMQGAYDRERKLAPILADMQCRGVRLDVDRMEQDARKAVEELHRLDGAVREKLHNPTLELGSDAKLVEALKVNGYDKFLLTPTGKASASKDSLDKALSADPELREMLRDRSIYATLTSTFMLPYIEMAKANNGRLHPSYNQVRNPEGFGTRTGRLSSSKPNFQNQPGNLGDKFPLIRSYMLPEEGDLWVTGDFKNQEPRIAAHFEDGALCGAFSADNNLDPYMFVVEAAGGITRKQAKVVLLGLLYAMGAATLAERLEIEVEHATSLRNIIKAALPDIVRLDYDCKRRFQLKLPIKTLGGRLYNCEPPSNGRSWEYKALNTLIQGSAADQTKEALIYIHECLLPTERILGTVHDEISVSCKPERVDDIKAIMALAANKLACDVHMLMDIGVGTNWAGAK